MSSLPCAAPSPISRSSCRRRGRDRCSAACAAAIWTWSSSPTRVRRPASPRTSWDRTGCSSSGAATFTRASREASTDAELRGFPIVEIDPGHGEPQLIPEDAQSYAVASNVATVKALVLAGFGVGEVPDFMLTPDETAALVPAAVPHDPDCGLYLVTAASWSGRSEERIAATLTRLLSPLLGPP